MIDLKFDHVSKKYRIREESTSDAARHPLMRKLRNLRRRASDFWAVRDVSFEVKRGEALGIIGHNGAGKSTILKLLSNITAPTSGEITINGRLSALIEVGSGFHPELTGRENIYLNGSILGMRRREISDKLESIVDFAGIRQFIDTPVKRFSSGMYVRLGFSIAAHLDPDILLLDEVLAVGDAAFQAKCLQRITELRESGTTIVFISHDLSAVERLCDRVLLMGRGQVVASGAPREVIDQYQSSTNASNASQTSYSLTDNGEKAAEIFALSFLDAEGHKAPLFRTGMPLTARIEFTAHASVADAVFDILFISADGVMLCEATTEVSGGRISLEPGPGAIEFSFPELVLLPGIYHTDVGIRERGAPGAIHWQYRSTMLRVDVGKFVRGHFYLPNRWQLIEGDGVSISAPPGESFGEVAHNAPTLRTSRPGPESQRMNSNGAPERFTVATRPVSSEPIQIVLSRDASRQVRATITITNTTAGPIAGVTMTRIRATTLDGAGFVDGVPVQQTFGTLNQGQSVVAVVTFPGTSEVPAEDSVIVQVDLSFAGDTYSETKQVVTP